MPSTATDRLNGLTTSLAVKPAVQAITSANITLSGLTQPTLTLGSGIAAIAEGTRVLVKDQTDTTENAIYLASTSDWTRAKDFDGNRDAVNGTLVVFPISIGNGALYQVECDDDPIIIGTSEITFSLRDNPNLTYPIIQPEIDAAVVPTNYAYDITDYSEVRRYGYVADDATDNSTALGKALSVRANGGPRILLPAGTARYSTSLNLPSKCALFGAGKEQTILRYTGAAQAFKQATPSSRIYEMELADFSLYDIGTGTVGLDLESISTSNFNRMWIDGFTTGIRIHSPTSGFAVYNRFYDVTCNSGASTKGFVLSGTSSNAHLFIGCRANFSSTTSTRGWDISDSNGNQIIGCHPEGAGIAVYLSASGPGVTGGNLIMANRIEGCTTGVQIASSDVEATRLSNNYYVANTTDIIDSGSRTILDEPSLAPGFQRIYTSAIASSASGNMRFVREASGGSFLPFQVIRDDNAAAGNPVTQQIETERATGVFQRRMRGGSVIGEHRADGSELCAVFTVATLPVDAQGLRAFVNDANATTFNSVLAGGGANLVPVFNDGADWRIG